MIGKGEEQTMRHRKAYQFLCGVLLITLLQGCASPTPALTSTPLPPTSTYTPAPTGTPTATPISWPLLQGLAYSPYRDCQSPGSPNQPTLADVRQDLQILQGMANGIRTYSSTGSNAEIPAIARQMGLRVSAGAYLGTDRAANEREIQGLIEIARQVDVESVIVGNEVLLRGDLTEDELLEYINQVKKAVNVPVTSAETGSILLAHPKVMAAVDFEMVHLYPFWEGASIDGAAQTVINQYHEVQKQSNGKRVVIGETGWPSSGPVNKAAVPSPENQTRFAKEFLTLAMAENVDFFYFDAFDEMWKTEGGVGPYWGLLYADRTFKSDIQSVMISYNASSQPATSGDGTSTTPVATQMGLGLSDFYVYSNFGDPENHFAPDGWMGDFSAVDLNICWTREQTWPQTAIRVTYSPLENDALGWAGMYWLDGGWGTKPDAGFDLSPYRQLVFWARAEVQGTQVKFFVGGVTQTNDSVPMSLPYPSSIKTPIFAQEADPLDGFVSLTTSWQEYHIDLAGADLHHVIDGFGWAAERLRTPEGATFYLDDIQFVPAAPVGGVVPALHIFSGKLLRDGLDLGVDTSGHFYNWVQDQNGQMEASYPPNQDWGAIFITVGNPALPGYRKSMDLSSYRYLSVDMKGLLENQIVYIGIKDRNQPDDGSETLLPVPLTSQWNTYTFDLKKFIGANLARVYIPIEFVFKGYPEGETIYFRNVQYLP
jgi:exo-beta-1,3-glucanase (GH17 family)